MPDGGYGWIVVACVFLFNFYTIGVQQSYSIFIGYYLNVLFAGTVNASQVSLTVSMMSGFSFLLGPFVGRLTDQYGPRLTALIGVVLMVIANVSASFCTTIQTIWVTQGILFGIGCCFAQNAAVSAPAQYFSKRLAMAFGIGISGSGIGGLAFSFITAALLSNLGSPWTLRVYAIISAGMLFPAALLLRRRVKPPKDAAKTPFFNVSFFKNAQFLRLFAGAFICCMAFPAPFFLPSYVYDKGMDPSIGTNLVAVTTGLSAVGTVLGGLAASRFGTLNVFVVSQLFAALSTFMFWIPAGTNAALLYFYAAFWGIFWGPFFSLLASAAAVLFVDLGPFPVVIGSIYLSICFAFFANGPTMGALIDAGAVYDSSGTRVSSNYVYAQIFCGSMYLLGVLFLAWVRFVRAKWKLVAKV
ncbi:major facilitator superfamily domain-containing protein [Hyaloraphidium curvatum]|nr:major facilitator superfamily domain-containing protein [Hyaloraphidium curvatum]KAI9007661.1 major facilitator superfamily domain-containing protein [Hyaloraphidium curvatum]